MKINLLFLEANPFPSIQRALFFRLIVGVFFLFFLQSCGDEAKKIRVPAVELYHEAYVAYEDEYFQEAEKKFQVLVDEHPNTQLATLAYLKMGDLNFKRSKWEDAEVNYRMFLTLNPQSHLTPYVLNRLIGLNFEKNYYGAEIVAVKDGEYIGSTDVEFYPKTEPYKGWTGSLGVLKKYRRKGIATALKIKVIEALLKKGITEVRTEELKGDHHPPARLWQ